MSACVHSSRYAWRCWWRGLGWGLGWRAYEDLGSACHVFRYWRLDVRPGCHWMRLDGDRDRNIKVGGQVSESSQLPGDPSLPPGCSMRDIEKVESCPNCGVRDSDDCRYEDNQGNWRCSNCGEIWD